MEKKKKDRIFDRINITLIFFFFNKFGVYFEEKYRRRKKCTDEKMYLI